MMYILDDSGYIEEFSPYHISCNNKSCVEYTGTIPEGYETLEEWAIKSNIRAYKIVNGNLTFDADRDAELQEEYNTVVANEKVVITTKNAPPDASGLWTLIDKEFAPLIEVSDDGTYFTNGKVSSCTVGIARRGHSIYTRFDFVNSTTLSDTKVNIGNLKLNALGVSNLSFSKYQNGHSDGEDGMFMAQLSDTGELNSVDVIGKTSSATISSGGTCYVEFTHIISMVSMLDEACNKFYWKRGE